MRAIVNVTPSWGIGFEQNLLVQIHADMRRFRALTQNNTIIIGRKTMETFPNGKPLKNRDNIVLTHNPDFQAEGAIVCHDLSELKGVLKDRDPDSVYACGGEHVYRLLLPYCTEALVTLTYRNLSADRFFPNLNLLSDWSLTEIGEKQWEGETAFRYLTYRNMNVEAL